MYNHGEAMASLKTILYRNHPITVSRREYKAVLNYVLRYESTPKNALALNTDLLGVDKIVFTDNNILELFSIFEIDMENFRESIHKADGITPEFLTTSNPYNILIVYLCHMVLLSNQLNNNDKHRFQNALLNMLHYSFFTSKVRSMLPYGADKSTMQYTLDHLSGKYMIKNPKTNTWKKLLDYKSKDILGKNSIHKDAIVKFSEDEKVTYMISDMKTRINKQIVGIVMRYHKNKEAGHKIDTDDTVRNNKNGEKEIKAITSSLDSTIASLTANVTNLYEFIDPEMIDIVIKITHNVKKEQMTALLTKFSDLAITQKKKGHADLIEGSGNSRILVGYRTLLSELIQKTYRACILDKDVDIKSKVSILNKTQRMYRSSMISDQDILVIKSSVEKMVVKSGGTSRASTIASLKIGFIIYIILLTFKFM